MVELVFAERFDGRAAGGATWPSKMGCVDQAAQRLDVFVKASSQQCTPGGLVRELIGCRLAETLGIAVARPVLVEVPALLIDQIRTVAPPMADLISGSVQPLFGSVALDSGFILCRPPVKAEDVGLRGALVEMWAFDQLLLNPDRTYEKPNCLIKGDKLALIDHEKALNLAGLGGFLLPAPWEDRWVPGTAHMVHDTVRSSGLDLSRLRNSWNSVDETTVDRLCSEVPNVWDHNVKLEIRDYLVQLHANLEAAFTNLERVIQ